MHITVWIEWVVMAESKAKSIHSVGSWEKAEGEAANKRKRCSECCHYQCRQSDQSSN